MCVCVCVFGLKEKHDGCMMMCRWWVRVENDDEEEEEGFENWEA